MGRLVGRMLQDEKINFLYYFGSLSGSEKARAISDFSSKDNIHVLVRPPSPFPPFTP